MAITPGAFARTKVALAAFSCAALVHAHGESAPAKVGEAIFQDASLSADGKVSCAICHRSDLAFTDARSTSQGAYGRSGTRNAPSLLNAAAFQTLFWDGRRESLRDQVLVPFTTSEEHGLSSRKELEDRVRARPYAAALKWAFGGREVSSETIAEALEAFIIELPRAPSRFDRYWATGEAAALNDQELRGLQLFQGPAKCASCHQILGSRPAFTDNQFHSLTNTGSSTAAQLMPATLRASSLRQADLEQLIPADSSIAALGRFNVTKRPGDIGLFRTPSLVNVARTAPYMHDGSVATLQEAVELEIYYRSTQSGRPIVLTAAEKADLIAFLKALSTTDQGPRQGKQ